MGAGDVAETVRVDTVFERFPASVRGAVVVRGRDADPHHVALQAADVVEVPAPTRSVRPLELGEVIVNVAPRKDVMIPFEIPFAGLDPGWYQVTAEVLVDGQERVQGPPEDPPRFVVAWPSGSTRRGTLEAGLALEVPGSGGATIDRIVCKPEAATVHWRHAASDDPAFREFGELRVNAGRARLHQVEETYEFGSGARATTVYPVLKEHEELTFTLDRRYRPGEPVQQGTWSTSMTLD